MSKKRLLTVSVVAVMAVVIALFVHPVRVWYHRARMVAELEASLESGPEIGQNPHAMAFERHVATLARLGYFQCELVPLKTIPVPSARSRALTLDLARNLQTEDGSFMMCGYDWRTTGDVKIWATPSKMRELKGIVQRHDSAAHGIPGAPTTTGSASDSLPPEKRD